MRDDTAARDAVSETLRNRKSERRKRCEDGNVTYGLEKEKAN